MDGQTEIIMMGLFFLIKLFVLEIVLKSLIDVRECNVMFCDTDKFLNAYISVFWHEMLLRR
jgi:hypothetical protein